MSLGMTLLLGGIHPVYAIQYVPSSSDEETGQVSKEDKEDADDLILAENIIIQMNADGYVVSHGDHYHHYNGKIPADSIFSEALLTPENYEFKEADLVSQVDDGYIVECEGKYYLYLPNRDQVENVRTKSEISLQARGLSPRKAKEIADLPNKLNLQVGEKIEIQDTQENQAKPSHVVYVTQGYFVILEEGKLFLATGYPKKTDLFLSSLVREKNEGHDLLHDQGTYQVYQDGEEEYILVQNQEQVFDLE